MKRAHEPLHFNEWPFATCVDICLKRFIEWLRLHLTF